MAGKILITPNAGSTTVDPTIAFQGAGVATDITLRVPSIGGLSFEGTTGQLFSISDSMSGTIFSVNDISGIPSIEVLDTGLVKLAQYSGNVLLGTATDNGTNKLQVSGSILATSFTGAGTGLTGTAASLSIGGNAATATSATSATTATTATNQSGGTVSATTGSFSGVLTSPKILINRSSAAATGIGWYSNTYSAWTDYMSQAAATGCGPYANITAPTGTLVTSWGQRSFIENSTGYGWTFESGTANQVTPTIVAEIRSSDGAARFAGAVTAASFSGPLTGNVTGNVTGSSGSCTGNAATATTATNLSGGTVSATTGSFSGLVTGPNPGYVTAITSLTATATSFNVPLVTVPNSGTNFVPLLHGSTNLSGAGYTGHVSFGALRTGTNNWVGGAYLGLGGNDAYSTEYYTFGFGGTISHSSGTTNIAGNISGNAATATTATTATSLTSSNFITQKGSGGSWNTDFGNTPAGTATYNGDVAANGTNGPGGSWWIQQNFRHTNNTNTWGTQVAWGWEDNANKLATRNITGGVFGNWIYYLNSTNFTTYTPSLTGTGASGSWGISVTGSSASCTGNAATATLAANSTLAGGLAIATGTNNVANQIVRTDGSGYIQAGYINSGNGNEGNASTPVRIWGTNGSDAYLRSYLVSSFVAPNATTAASCSGNAATATTATTATSAGLSSIAGGVVYENTRTISANYTMTSGRSGSSTGPITINTGVTVTIPSGSRWVVL